MNRSCSLNPVFTQNLFQIRPLYFEKSWFEYSKFYCSTVKILLEAKAVIRIITFHGDEDRGWAFIRGYKWEKNN